MNIEDHITYSKDRLQKISNQISSIPELKENKLCIYTTGSYGRFEASKNSDLDLFFLDSDESKETTNINKILINAAVIKICKQMNLPDFSNDGEYLKIHRIGEILTHLGSHNDDYFNHFTARMLLLLESKPIYNTELHTNCLEKVIARYYGDFHDHSSDFLPIFLSNDIIRFWKTLCLNYEHKRRRENDRVRNVAHSKNLKLKFSRKLTCFSFIIKLADAHGTISKDDILTICKMTPIERLESIKENKSDDIKDKIQNALNTYQWFLDKTQIPSNELLTWISDKNLRSEAFNNSNKFADELFSILELVDNQKILPKLLI